MMNKTSAKSQSMVTAKAGINPNIPPFVPQLHPFQGSNVSYMSSMTPFNARPALWQPLSQPYGGYGFYNHQMNNPWNGSMAPLNHPMHCCHSSHNSCGHHCDHNCNQWPNGGQSIGNNCWTHKDKDINDPKATAIVESITEIKSEDSDCEVTSKETELQKRIKQLKAMNKQLKTTSEKAITQLKETKESLLEMNEKLVIDYIEKYQQNLKKYGAYIRDECNRFVQNPEMSKKLEPIVEQMKTALKKANDEKERVRKWTALKRESLNDDESSELEEIDFDENSLPEFPDLLRFYKSILDEIPLVFFKDMCGLKLFTNNYIQNKDKVVDNNCLPFPSQTSKQLSNTSQSLFPIVSHIPETNDFSLFPPKDNSLKTVLPLKPIESTEPALKLTFPRSESPIDMFNQFSNRSEDKPFNPSVTQLNSISLNSNPMKEKSIAELFADSQPIPTKSQLNCQQNNASNVVKPPDVVVPSDTFRPPRMAPVFAKHKTSTPAIASAEPLTVTSAESTSASKPVLNLAQNKLLAKLKEKYNTLSDEILIDCMAQTKASLISSGDNPKGFTGMKVSEIIEKISQYIDRNIVLMNKMAKSRITRPIPTLKLMSNNASEKVMTGELKKNETKTWNIIGHKIGTNNENICSICIEEMSLKNRFETDCHHFFHSECITNWLRTDGSCPICRSLVLSPGEFPVL